MLEFRENSTPLAILLLLAVGATQEATMDGMKGINLALVLVIIENLMYIFSSFPTR